MIFPSMSGIRPHAIEKSFRVPPGEGKNEKCAYKKFSFGKKFSFEKYVLDFFSEYGKTYL